MNIPFDCDKPISIYPEGVQRAFRLEALYVYNELQDNKNKIETHEQENPYPSYVKLRRQVAANPPWYSKMYRELCGHLRSPTHQSVGGGGFRQHILKALHHISAGSDKARRDYSGGAHYTNHSLMRNEVHERLTKGGVVIEHGIEVDVYPPQRLVCAYFGVVIDEGKWAEKFKEYEAEYQDRRICPHNEEHNKNRAIGYVRDGHNFNYSVCFECWGKQEDWEDVSRYHSPHGSGVVAKWIDAADKMDGISF